MLFSLEDVSLSRSGERVLCDLTLGLDEGATAIVGPSGSGKSSLLRLLNRLSDPDSGIVRFRGRDVRELDPRELRRRACLVPQLPAPIPGTVAKNIDYAAELAGTEPDHGRLLALAGLDAGFDERATDRLSVGQLQRAMLARALAVEPEVLLLDEPTSALDPEATAAVEDALGGLRRRAGISLVLVTHDPEQASRVAGRTIRIEAGQIPSARGAETPSR